MHEQHTHERIDAHKQAVGLTAVIPHAARQSGRALMIHRAYSRVGLTEWDDRLPSKRVVRHSIVRRPRASRILTIALAGVIMLFGLANVRVYSDVPDPDRDFHAVHGVVLIIPSPDRCFGVEVEDVTHHIDFFGEQCQ